MATIRKVLQLLGYSELKQESITKLLLLNNESGSNAFLNFIHLSGKKELDLRRKHWIDLILNMGITEKNIPEDWIMNTDKKWQNQSFINALLDFDFNVTHYQLFQFIVALTQLQFILGSRFEMFSSTTNLYEMDEKKNSSFAMVKLVQDLGFSLERTYQKEDGPIESLFLHAATEIALTPRIALIKDIVDYQQKEITVYYPTNPRGLSKSEESTAEILASWFSSDKELQLKLTQHLRELLARKEIKFDWFNGLNKLRELILNSVNEQFDLKLNEFPSAPYQEIYPEIYDQTAFLDGNRDPLNNKWPHVRHLIHHLANKAGLTPEKVHFEIILVPGSVIENKYKPAQTQDLIESFFKSNLNLLLSDNATIYAISDNSITYGGVRQHMMMDILAKQRNKSVEVITYYDKVNTKQLDFERITKEIAAQLYTVYELDNHLTEKLEKDEEKNNCYSV